MAADPKVVAPPPPPPVSDLVNVEVDGKPCQGKKGAMIIHLTDAADAYVPRFCYHEKLPIAANCRMCLVEVEKAPKPLPACATPIAEGMKIFTKSPNAIAAQRATMEFLLINHPLDCPICDQGGECELQDLAMGFGRDISRFQERKRVVKDKNLGPLVSTDMTRCIHCTRCVRFGQDVAGIQELGTTGRGEHMEIGTFIERSVDHELSGNIIDLCPVGALNSKPFRFRARAWEMTQHALVAPHDGFGSNIYAHVLRGRLMRVVPRPNEAINETWVSDRDRFSYEGLYAADRLTAPMVREQGEWRKVDWQTALNRCAQGLQAAGAGLDTLVSASATVEELYLAAKLTRALGSNNVDHRLRQQDFRGDAQDSAFPALGVAIAAAENLTGLLVVGSHLRLELPMLAHRVRKAARKGARVAFVNPTRFDYLFPVAGYVASSYARLADDLSGVIAALPNAVVPGWMADRSKADRTTVTDAHRAAAAALANGERRAIWLGALALRHPQYAEIRALAQVLADNTSASLGVLAEGANAAGAYLAGAVPHRNAGGVALAAPGRHAAAMLAQSATGYFLVGGVEPWADAIGGADRKLLAGAGFVAAVTPFASDELKSIAQVLLPMSAFAETSGSFVNLEGRWQSWAGAIAPPGEARPGWKILRVLGNLLNLSGFDYNSSEEVRDELQQICANVANKVSSRSEAFGSVAVRGGEPAGYAVVPYRLDALVRRAPALQAITAAG
jgi:NADH-quinone oxidoreductase subunit G